MGLLNRWDKRNQSVLEVQNEDMGREDWATNSTMSRRASVSMGGFAATFSLGGLVGSVLTGWMGWVILAALNAAVWALVFWRMRRIT